MTKATISRGTPSASIDSIARGKAASELVVLNAIVAGSATALMNRRTGTLNNHATGSRTPTRNTAIATYMVAISLIRLKTAPNPVLATVYAIAPAIPKGASSMTMLVNLNITSARLSAKVSRGRRFSSRTIASAMPNTIEKTTICNTWFSATDLAMFSGNACRMMSDAVGLTVGSFSVAAAAGSWTPTPALLRLIATRPMSSARVVTISK